MGAFAGLSPVFLNRSWRGRLRPAQFCWPEIVQTVGNTEVAPPVPSTAPNHRCAPSVEEDRRQPTAETASYGPATRAGVGSRIPTSCRIGTDGGGRGPRSGGREKGAGRERGESMFTIQQGIFNFQVRAWSEVRPTTNHQLPVKCRSRNHLSRRRGIWAQFRWLAGGIGPRSLDSAFAQGFGGLVRSG